MGAQLTVRRAVPVLLLALAVAGCGGSGSGSSSASSASSVATATSSAAPIATGTISATAPRAPNGVASKSAKQIVADAEAALGQVHSFHVAGTTVNAGRPSTITGDVQIPGRLSVSLVSGPTSAHIITVDGKIYFNANPAYFTAQHSPPAVIQQLANRWVTFPTGSGPSLGTLAAAVNPATVGECIVAAHPGTLSVKGTGSVNGQPAVIVADAGDVPGSTPGRLYVATTGPPLPLRAVQTGHQKPGGTPNATCDETAVDVSGQTTASVATYSQFNSAAAINAPPGAIPINGAGGSSAG